MPSHRISYPVLTENISIRGVTRSDIAKELGISPRSLLNKMRGLSAFKWQEALFIQHRFFPDIPIEKLFAEAKDLPEKPP